MSNQFVELVSSLIERLAVHARRDAALRDDLRSLAQAILTEMSIENETVPDAAGSVPERAEEGFVRPQPASELAGLLWPAQRSAAADEIAQRSLPAHARTSEPIEARIDLAMVDQRCRLKAEGIKWCVERQWRIGSGADFRNEIAPIDSDLISRAKNLPDCFLWMSHPSGPAPTNEDDWEDAAGCFENLADVIKLIREIGDDREEHADVFERSLDLMAEAQSAVRSAVARIDGPPDADQRAAYQWLRDTVTERQVFIQRYMRSSEPADSVLWEDLSNRIDQLDARFQRARQTTKLRKKRLKKVSYVVNQIRAGDADSKPYQWSTLVNTVEELCGDGLLPSNRELRELLLPVIDAIPDDVGAGGYMNLVLREVDRFLASQPADEKAPQASTLPTAEVRRVAAALNGKKVVMIGGERRLYAQAALEAAFGLKELIWVSMREHESPSILEPVIASHAVEVVLLAIRWSSHSYGEAKQYCDQNSKHFVRLKAGYNPNQVAVHIIDQCPSLFNVGQ